MLARLFDLRHRSGYRVTRLQAIAGCLALALAVGFVPATLVTATFSAPSRPSLLAKGAGGLGPFAVPAPSGEPVAFTVAEDAPGKNWPSYGGTLTNQRYSTLN